MTTCPSCARPLSGPACVSCAPGVPPLPDGLFRDAPAEAGGLLETASFTPDFLPVAPPSTVPPELPEDLFRDAAPEPPAPEPPAPGAAGGVGEPSHAPYEDTADRSFGFRQFGSPETMAFPVPVIPTQHLAPPLQAPGRPGSPETDLLPSERVPAPSEARRRRTGLVLIVILVLLVATAVVGGTIWWNSSSPATATRATPSRAMSAPASAAGSSAPEASTPASAAPAPVASSPAAAPVVFPPPGARVCTERVAVNEATSCPFAGNVAAALPTLTAGESRTITATSPTTGQTYQMTCRLAGYVTCTGGTNAVVYVKVAS